MRQSNITTKLCVCTPLQPAEVGVKLSTSRLPPRKLLDIQDADKYSGLNDTGLTWRVKLEEGL